VRIFWEVFVKFLDFKGIYEADKGKLRIAAAEPVGIAVSYDTGIL
jgi:hypothetical protein